MHNDRPTEHSATEEVHLHYQSRRGHCTIWTSPIPPAHYQSPRGQHSYTHFAHPLFLLPISTGAPQIHTLFGHPSSNTPPHGDTTNTLLWTPPIPTTNHHGGHTFTHSFGHPSPNTYLHGGTTNTLFLDTPTPIYTTQLWLLYPFRLFV
jgi:hypothetical protein